MNNKNTVNGAGFGAMFKTLSQEDRKFTGNFEFRFNDLPEDPYWRIQTILVMCDAIERLAKTYSMALNSKLSLRECMAIVDENVKEKCERKT